MQVSLHAKDNFFQSLDNYSAVWVVAIFLNRADEVRMGEEAEE
jgi:hypothetical protein